MEAWVNRLNRHSAKVVVEQSACQFESDRLRDMETQDEKIQEMRERIATHALQGMLAKGNIQIPCVLAHKAILYADALILELLKKQR